MTETATKYAVFDLDGTIADNEHRVSLIRGEGKPNWDAYHEACDKDAPIYPIIHLMRSMMMSARVQVIILTGRTDSVVAKTENWLEEHLVDYDKMVMRPAGNKTPDYEWKAQWVRDNIGFENVFFAVEDRRRVVDMWRNNGVLCLHCAEGEF